MGSSKYNMRKLLAGRILAHGEKKMMNERYIKMVSDRSS